MTVQSVCQLHQLPKKYSVPTQPILNIGVNKPLNHYIREDFEFCLLFQTRLPDWQISKTLNV